MYQIKIIHFTFDSEANALASRVFPQPGGPKRRAPFGTLAPKTLYLSGCLR